MLEGCEARRLRVSVGEMKLSEGSSQIPDARCSQFLAEKSSESETFLPMKRRSVRK